MTIFILIHGSWHGGWCWRKLIPILKSEAISVRAGLIIAGVLSAAVFAFISYEFVIFPSIYGGNSLSYTFLLASFIGGLILYLAHKSYLKKQGIDLSLAFKEIPPE
jgi:glutamate:GABA antiporter